MYTPTEAQLAAEKRLIRKGYEFANWIAYCGDESYPHGTMVMVKRSNRHTRLFAEIEPNGTVN